MSSSDVVASVPVQFESAGLRLAADRWVAPDARGTVLLLHGGGQTRHSWHRAGARLSAAGWTTYALDARGHGESGWAPDADYTIPAMVADLRAVITQIGGEPPVLVGASMGGSVGLVAAGEDPALARALILVDIVPKIEPDGVKRITDFMLGHADGFASLEEVAAAIHAYNPHRKRPSSEGGLRKNVRRHDDGRWYWHWDPAFLQGGPEPDRAIGYDRSTSAARAVRVPTLLVRGQDSDIVSDAGVREFLALIDGAQYVDIAEAGHMVAGDDNDVFGAAVVEFLDRL